MRFSGLLNNSSIGPSSHQYSKQAKGVLHHHSLGKVAAAFEGRNLYRYTQDTHRFGQASGAVQARIQRTVHLGVRARVPRPLQGDLFVV